MHTLLKMWFLSILFVAVFCTVRSQTSTIFSTEWEYQQIEKSLMEREKRIKDLISDILPKIESNLANLSSNAKLSLLVNALVKLKNRLVDYSTILSYSSQNVTLTCNEIVAKVLNFVYNNQKCLKIKIENDVNSTLLYVDISSFNVAYVANYFNLIDVQRHNIQLLVTSLMILVNEYNQHSVTLVMAMYKHARLYIELLYFKKSFCNCPSQLSSSSNSTLATVDSNLKQIQANVDVRETSIRTKSTEVITKIAAASSDLKKTASNVFITTTLDSIATLCKGYQQLTTTETINLTLNCDDAGKKIALIQYKFELYFQMNFEATVNTTFVLFYLNSLNIYYITNYRQLTDVQRKTIKEVMTSMKTLVQEFTQLILTFSISLVKLKIELQSARTAGDGSCSCTGTPNGTEIIVSTVSTSMLEFFTLLSFYFFLF
jgi:hypothetical protein